MEKWPIRLVIVGGMLLVSLALLSPQSALAGVNGNPGILPPQSKPYGMTYGAWGAEWWKWAYARPTDQNPILDPDGAFGSADQIGPVWFLAGTFGGSAERTITIPYGKAIFFPLINIFVDYPCPPDQNFEPAPGQSLEDFLTDFAVRIIDQATALSAEVDGVALQNLFDYRAHPVS